MTLINKPILQILLQKEKYRIHPADILNKRPNIRTNFVVKT